jgi:UDP-glucose 4-epimerase
MRVLITGGAGFIGSHLTDRLLARGDEVLVIDNFATARHDNLPEHERLQLIEGTIVDTELVQKAFSEFEPEVVAHAAASYKDPDDWTEDAATNTTGSANVVKASQAAGVRRLVYFQTALCYGLHPLEQPITLDHPLRPEDSSYAISKTAGEYYVRLSGLDWVSLRLAFG